ncbi:MAG: serine hydrolase [Cyanobacteria bacterium]|nr:serine hydrolase [Cyanobacteriota bacterium]
MNFRVFCAVLAIGTLVTPVQRGSAQEQFPFEIFGRYLEPLAQQIGMPGVSAAIIQNGPGGRAVRRYNFGFADVERKIPARSDTPYAIGGVTQAMTGVLHGVCIDRFPPSVFDIDRDIRLFVPGFPVANTSVRQVLAHATDGRFRYDPALFARLTPVIESPQCLDKPFRLAMAAEVLDRFRGGMRRTVPGMDLNRPEGAAGRALFDDATVARYQAVLSELAVPYRIDARGRASRSEYPSYGLDAASGMVSTVDDLVDFETQLDQARIDSVPFSASTLDLMWRNQGFDVPNGSGGTLRVVMPTGLGWFVTTESGQRLVWTFGYIQDASSALIVKILPPANAPTDRRLTLIMLANSGGLAQGYDLENANVTSNPFVKVFLRLFI